MNSGVNNYLEFKSIEKLNYFSEADSSLYPVPCSKNEGGRNDVKGCCHVTVVDMLRLLSCYGCCHVTVVAMLRLLSCYGCCHNRVFIWSFPPFWVPPFPAYLDMG